MPSQNTWKLVAPDWSALDTIWRNPLPFLLWPAGNQPLLAHWMDEAVRSGAEGVELYVADRPAEVRAWLQDGAYWSRRVKLIPISAEADAPMNAVPIEWLPGCERAAPIPQRASELLRYWFDLQKAWIDRHLPGTHTIESRHSDGGSIGPRVRIHPSARMTPPFWIGAGAQIGARTQIGPYAFVGNGSVVDEETEVEQAFVAPNTYVGKHTRLYRSIADGSVLVDFERDCKVRIEESFIMGPVVDRTSGPTVVERLAAAAAFALLAPFAGLWNGGGWSERSVAGRGGKLISLRTGRRGPLWARRWPWLAQIVKGHLHWIGILPREESEWQNMPPETAQRLRCASVGVFSLADRHGCHEPSEPEEWIHAAYQAFGVDLQARAQVSRNLWRIAWSKVEG